MKVINFTVFIGILFITSAAPASEIGNLARQFHAVEPRGFDPDIITDETPKLPPLRPADPDFARYHRVAQLAEHYLAGHSEGTATALYIAAMCYSRLDIHAKALIYLDRLLAEYPNLRRSRLIGHPEFDRPARADLLHLRLYHHSQLIGADDPLGTLRSITQEGAASLEATAQWRETIKHQPYLFNIQLFEELEHRNPTPEQLRAAGVPSVATLVMKLHDALLPKIVHATGAKATRDYLREMAADGQPFRYYALRKLVEIDAVILAGYWQSARGAAAAKQWAKARAGFQLIIDDYAGTRDAAQAQAELRKAIVTQYSDEAAAALANKQFDNAKAAYRKIINEFRGSEEAAWAEGELRKIVPVAVKYYKEQGDLNFHPQTQLFIPQTKAKEFFEKMYKEDPDGPQADYALYYWSRGLGMERKVTEAISHLEESVRKFPDSPLRCKTEYLIAFYKLGEKPEEGIQLMMRIADKYPDRDEAPEALFHAAILSAIYDSHYERSIACLQKIQEKYPASPRCKHTADLIATFQERKRLGTKWP